MATLLGGHAQFCVQTDNVSLKDFTTIHDPGSRMAKFSEHMARFDYKIEYVSGESSVKLPMP